MSNDEELDDQEIPELDGMSEDPEQVKDYNDSELVEFDTSLPEAEPDESPESLLPKTPDVETGPKELPEPELLAIDEGAEPIELPPDLMMPAQPGMQGGMGQIPRERRDDMSLEERTERWAEQPEDERGDRPGRSASDEDFALARKADNDAQQEWQDKHPQQNEQEVAGQGGDKNEQVISLLTEIRDSLQRIEDSDDGSTYA